MRIHKIAALILGAALCFSSSPAFAREGLNSSEADDHSRYIKLIAGSS